MFLKWGWSCCGFFVLRAATSMVIRAMVVAAVRVMTVLSFLQSDEVSAVTRVPADDAGPSAPPARVVRSRKPAGKSRS